jgi:prepilin-type N-terminal cleavage/methylation domain-containing protein
VQLKRPLLGFTLTEMAVVLAIITLLIGGAMATLASIAEQRDNEETTRRLNAAVDALIGYAVVNKRLPCPAVSGATGVEAPAGGATACTNPYGGFLPAQTIGFTPVDSSGYGVDSWGNRLRYAVAATVTGCSGSSTVPHFTNQANLKANGVSCKPNDIDVFCSTAASGTSSTCNSGIRVADQNTIAFIVFSTGKNGAVSGSGQGADDLANTDGNANFVNRFRSTTDSALGIYDDVMVIVQVGVFYQKLIAAGVLP